MCAVNSLAESVLILIFDTNIQPKPEIKKIRQKVLHIEMFLPSTPHSQCPYHRKQADFPEADTSHFQLKCFFARCLHSRMAHIPLICIYYLKKNQIYAFFLRLLSKRMLDHICIRLLPLSSVDVDGFFYHETLASTLRPVYAKQ